MSIICGHIFKALKNQRGDPWKSKNYLLRGVNEGGWRGSGAFLNPPRVFLLPKNLKNENVATDNRQVPILIYARMHLILFNASPAFTFLG